MKHLAIPDDELYTIIYALRCGEMQLRELTDTLAKNPGPRTPDVMRECHKMRMTLIRIENQLDPKA
jgi:hypothetical protein